MILFGKKGVDGNEFIKIYDDYNVAIYRYVFMRCGNIEAAQDITSETFLRAWNYFSKKNTEMPDNIRAYLYKIASNLIADYFKNNNKNVLLDEEVILDFYDNLDKNNSLNHEAGEMSYVLKAIYSLSENQKDILIFRYVEDLSYKDISMIMNKTEGALRVLHNRAIGELRKKLGT